MQKKLIAAAVAGALVAPQVLADVSVSGSIRNGVAYNASSWGIIGAVSRLRFKASSDLGNGQSVYMNYEFSVDSGNGNIGTDKKTQRLTYVGMKGDWGSLSLGAQWSTAFNTVGTFIDKSLYYGDYGNNCVQYRMANSAMLSTQLGGLSLMADAQMDPATADSLDRATVGGLFAIGGVSLGAMYQNATDDCMGAAAAINVGGIGLSGGFVDSDANGSSFGVNGSIGGLTVMFDSDDNGDEIVGNYTMGLGGGAKMILEVESNDAGENGGLFLRYDF